MNASLIWAGRMAFLASAMAAFVRAQTDTSTDWPSWRGPFSSGASDSGQEWVDTLDAARQAWVSDPVGLSGCGHGSPDHLATGFCDPVIVGGRVFLYWFERSGTNRVEWERIAHSRSFGMRLIKTSYGNPAEVDDQSKFSADDVFVCLDANTGKTLWKRVFAGRGFNHRKVYSPLAVPCVSNGRLYGLGSAGRLYCMEAATGKTIWESDVGLAAQHFEQMRALCRATAVRGYEPNGFNHAVMVIDGVVIVGDSGSPLENDAEGDEGIVGLDAQKGEPLWHVRSCLYVYGMPACWRHQGKTYVLAAGKSRMVAVEPRTGRVVWEHKAQIDQAGRVQSPVCECVALTVSGDYAVVNGGAPTCYRMDLSGVRKVWELPMAESHYCWLVAAVILGNHAYVSVKGGVGCVELETGKLLGTVEGFAAAGIRGYSGGDGRLVDSSLAMVKAWPDFRKLEGKLPGTWRAGYAHSSTVADGRVYIRGREHVYCYDFRRNPPVDKASPSPVLSGAPDLDAMKNDPLRLAALAQKEDWPARGAALERLRGLGAGARPAAETLDEMLR
jgi:outer membrane protein assembly factor BamB